MLEEILSLMNVPSALCDEIIKLNVDTSKLKSITDYFLAGLEKGLSIEDGSIPMNPTWILDKPTDSEKDTYLALDLGGTNLRILRVTIEGDRHLDGCTQSTHCR